MFWRCTETINQASPGSAADPLIFSSVLVSGIPRWLSRLCCASSWSSRRCTPKSTVISSRTRRIWTDERNTRPQSLACHRRKCDLRAQLPHHLRRRCDAGCQAAMRTRVAFSPMQWGVWRTRITLIGPDPSCPAADDCVFGAHRRDDQRKAQQSLVSHRACKKAPTRGAGGPTLRRNGSHLRNGDGYLLRW